jgi:hypothetical protein
MGEGSCEIILAGEGDHPIGGPRCIFTGQELMQESQTLLFRRVAGRL